MAPTAKFISSNSNHNQPKINHQYRGPIIDQLCSAGFLLCHTNYHNTTLRHAALRCTALHCTVFLSKLHSSETAVHGTEQPHYCYHTTSQHLCSPSSRVPSSYIAARVTTSTYKHVGHPLSPANSYRCDSVIIQQCITML